MSRNNGNNNIEVFSTSTRPYGKGYSEWSEEWIKWAFSITKQCNPVTDDDGRNCAQGQRGPVWFLAGTLGGSVKRRCVVPRGSAILFPIVAKECSFAEDKDLKTESELIARTNEAMNNVTNMKATIDNTDLLSLHQYRIHSRVFDLTFPKNNIYGVEPGVTKSVTDGYWIILKPLSLGKHKIYFSAEVSLIPGSKLSELAQKYNNLDGTFFRTEATYELIVKG